MIKEIGLTTLSLLHLLVMMIFSYTDQTEIPKQPAAVLVEQAGELTGIYYCEGETYSGVVIIRKLANVYLVQWAIDGSSTVGIGARQGDVLSTGWTDGTRKGTTLFKIDGKRLLGRWASLPGDGRLHVETLTFIKELPPLPEPLPKE